MMFSSRQQYCYTGARSKKVTKYHREMLLLPFLRKNENRCKMNVFHKLTHVVEIIKFKLLSSFVK